MEHVTQTFVAGFFGILVGGIAMKYSRALEKEPLSPILVLEIIRDAYRQQCQFDPEAEPDIELTFNTTITEWRDTCDLLGWKPLGRAINQWFGVNYSDDEWRQTLEPAKTKTLSDVCELIAKTGQRLVINPLPLLGKNCYKAGVFVTLRTALSAAGAPLESLKPSSKLEPILLKHWDVFITEIGKLAPGVLPPVNIEGVFAQTLGCWLFLGGLGLGLVYWLANNDLLAAIALALGVSGVLLVMITSRMTPKKVSFGDLETFGELCSFIGESKSNNR